MNFIAAIICGFIILALGIISGKDFVILYGLGYFASILTVWILDRRMRIFK